MITFDLPVLAQSQSIQIERNSALETFSVPIELGGEGIVTISSLPRAKVYVDGEFVRTTPLFRHTVPSGAREIELKTKDGRSHTFKLNVRKGAELNRVWSFGEGKFVGQ